MDNNHRGVRGGRGGGPGNSRQSNFSYTGAPSSGTRIPNDLPLRILVPSDMVGAIIGRGGVTVKQINQQSSAWVYVHENAGCVETIITIKGQANHCSVACQKILEVLQQKANNTNRGEILLKILAHDNLVGRIIGKHGNVKKHIMEQTNTEISVYRKIQDVNGVNLERIVTIRGTSDNICKAEQLISAILRQSYERDLAAMAPQPLVFPDLHPMTMMSTLGAPSCSSGVPMGAPYNMYNDPSAGSYVPMMYSQPQNQQGNGTCSHEPQKETVVLYIPNSVVVAIIGMGGCAIRDIVNSSGVGIHIARSPTKDDSLPSQPQSNEQPADRVVTLVGSPESQWKAQFMIFQKISYESFIFFQQYRLKVEIRVPSSQVCRLKGKGGQTVRELMRTTDTVINIPEESQTVSDDTPVQIFGGFHGSQAAQRQIRAWISINLINSQRSSKGPKTSATSSSQPSK